VKDFLKEKLPIVAQQCEKTGWHPSSLAGFCYGISPLLQRTTLSGRIGRDMNGRVCWPRPGVTARVSVPHYAVRPSWTAERRPSDMQTSSSTTSVATSNGSCVGTAISAAATPGSYMYTSSSGLLRSSRAVPPPTLPKYSGVSSSFRLASLDRLAHRQRQFDQQQGSSVTAPQQANGDVSPSQQHSAVSFNVVCLRIVRKQLL
jgi:hypothetical protein